MYWSMTLKISKPGTFSHMKANDNENFPCALKVAPTVLQRLLLWAQLNLACSFAWLSKEKWQVEFRMHTWSLARTLDLHTRCVGFLGRLSKLLLFKPRSWEESFCGTVTRENEFYVGPPTPCLDITDQECWYWQFVVRSFRLNELREWEKVGCFCPLLQDATFLRGQQGHTVNITPDGRPPPFTNPSLPLSLLYEAGYLVHRGRQIRCKVTLNT